jgi:Sulfotransferase domain
VRRKPNFFIVGAAKAGTSSLYNYIAQHPDVFMPELKEPHFFSEWKSPVLEIDSMEEYLRLFEEAPENARVGEASTSYLASTEAAQRIRRFNSDARIIMVLRNPVDRAYSQYWNHVRDNMEPLSFEQALEAEPERIREGQWHGFYYVEGGRYAEQVARYMDAFGRDSVRVYLFEDLSQDALGVCRDAFSFLRIDPSYPISARRVYNRGGPQKSVVLSKLTYRGIALAREVQKALGTGESVRSSLLFARLREVKEWLQEKNTKRAPEMKPETKRMLRRAYREDIVRLEGLIERNLRHWLE